MYSDMYVSSEWVLIASEKRSRLLLGESLVLDWESTRAMGFALESDAAESERGGERAPALKGREFVVGLIAESGSRR